MLPPFRANGEVNPDAQFGNAFLLAALYHQDQAAAQQYATLVGATLQHFSSDPVTLTPDWCFLRVGNEILIALAGTTNAPEWVGHIGSAFFPAIDTQTGHFAVNSFLVGEQLVENNIFSLIPPGNAITVRITGHSYGAAAAFILALHLVLRANAPGIIEVMTFGEPKSQTGVAPLMEPTLHDRIVRHSDPVQYSPPSACMLCGLGPLLSALKLSGNLGWHHFGERWQSSYGALAPVADPLGFIFGDLVGVVGGYSLAVTQHPMDIAYLPDAQKWWALHGADASLAALEPTVTSYTNFPFAAPAFLGPPVTPAAQGAAWFPAMPNPIDATNQPFWEVVSSQAIYHPFSGSSSMSQMKGTFLWHLGTGGFSESLYAVASPSLGYQGMLNLMVSLLPYRTALSIGPDMATCLNPLKIFGIRVEDELVPRDAMIQRNIPQPVGYANTPIAGQGIWDSNEQQNIAAKIRFATQTAGQAAVTYLHGIPLRATSSVGYALPQPGELRFAPMSTLWLANLKAYSDQIAALGLGLRYLNSPWDIGGLPGPMAKPVTFVYDAVTETYIATMPQAATNLRMRYVLRGFKNLSFLNGRWPGIVAGVNQIRILRKARGLTWDGTGTVSPEVWAYFTPSPSLVVPAGNRPGVVYSLITGKKIGRPFDLERGRARARAV